MNQYDHTIAPLPAGNGVSPAEGVVRRILRDYPGNMAVRLWNQRALVFGTGVPEFTLIFRDPAAFRELIFYRNPLRMAEAFFRGDLDFEGDLYAVLRLRDYLQSLRLSAREKAGILLGALFLRDARPVDAAGASSGRVSRLRSFAAAHSKARDREAVAFHYDVSNEFYHLWLDEQMLYSCAYFEDENDDLDRAQRNKLDYLCRKLRLAPGERLLDIGCGWGALVRWAARHYGVQAHGITLSRNQYEYARRKIEDEGLRGRVTVELRDYRDLQGEAVYDKIVSVGMFEHVGLKNFPVYFGAARRLLKPGGLFLNHGITHDTEGWRTSVSTAFINRYVFPDGELDTVGNVQRAMERTGFEILDVEALRPHYALTLRHWVRRLEGRREEALRHVSESTYRVWRLYMAACALSFEEGKAGVYQILAARRGADRNPVPLTRRDLYRQDLAAHVDRVGPEQ